MKILEALRSWAKKLKRDGITLWFACKHPATPWYAKALGSATATDPTPPVAPVTSTSPSPGRSPCRSSDSTHNMAV